MRHDDVLIHACVVAMLTVTEYRFVVLGFLLSWCAIPKRPPRARAIKSGDPERHRIGSLVLCGWRIVSYYIRRARRVSNSVLSASDRMECTHLELPIGVTLTQVQITFFFSTDTTMEALPSFGTTTTLSIDVMGYE